MALNIICANEQAAEKIIGTRRVLHLVGQILPSSRIAKCRANNTSQKWYKFTQRTSDKSFDLLALSTLVKIGWNLPSQNCNQVQVLMCCPEAFLSFFLQCVAASLSTVLCNLCAQLLQLLRCQVGGKLCYNTIVALEKVEVRQLGHSYFFTHCLQAVYPSIHLQGPLNFPALVIAADLFGSASSNSVHQLKQTYR